MKHQSFVPLTWQIKEVKELSVMIDANKDIEKTQLA